MPSGIFDRTVTAAGGYSIALLEVHRGSARLLEDPYRLARRRAAFPPSRCRCSSEWRSPPTTRERVIEPAYRRTWWIDRLVLLEVIAVESLCAQHARRC